MQAKLLSLTYIGPHFFQILHSSTVHFLVFCNLDFLHIRQQNDGCALEKTKCSKNHASAEWFKTRHNLNIQIICNIYKIGLLLCHSHIELRLRWSWYWGWNEVESKFSWNWVVVELSWGSDKLPLNKGRNWAFIWVGLWFKICFRSTHVAEQHMFSMSPSILAFNFI